MAISFNHFNFKTGKFILHSFIKKTATVAIEKNPVSAATISGCLRLQLVTLNQKPQTDPESQSD